MISFDAMCKLSTVSVTTDEALSLHCLLAGKHLRSVLFPNCRLTKIVVYSSFFSFIFRDNKSFLWTFLWQVKYARLFWWPRLPYALLYVFLYLFSTPASANSPWPVLLNHLWYIEWCLKICRLLFSHREFLKFMYALEGCCLINCRSTCTTFILF